MVIISNIYVYASDCEDFTNFGLVGALTPASCVFEEEANGLSEITMEHPLDALGKYTQLACNNILMMEVPVRTTPEIYNNQIVTSVEQWIVRPANTITKAQRTLYKKASGSSKIKVLPAGTEVTVTKKTDEGRYKVKCKYGTGYISPAGLSYSTSETIADNSQSIESVQPAWTVKPQFFRIYSVKKNISGVTVMARHISYDLLYNLTTYKNTGSVPCTTALAAIMAGCVADNDFTAYTNLLTERTGINWTRTNPIDALLNPETGLTALYGASLVRDNWELYVLHDPGMNRGVTVEYGKNMTGITYTESFDEVVTRIIPVGETKDGDDLLLSGDTPWVDSPRINDYPVVYAQELKCENCKVGTDGVTESIARARMVEQAQNVFNNGGDLPTVEMSVDFINLGDTAEYAQFKHLERLFLWDYVLIRHKLHGIDVTSRIVKIQWDCLLDRMQGMEIGTIGKTLANSGITTWQIPTGFSGSKIADGSIGNSALQSDIISTRHIQSESINTEALQAGSVTAEKIAAGAITADKLEADIVDAVSLEAITAHIESLTAESITTDRLAAALAAFTVVTAGTAEFDRATIQHLVADALNLSFGVGDEVFIKNLKVIYAQMVSAAIGNLVIKASDGNYYEIDVDANGNVSATLSTVTDGEISAGQTDAGKVILGTDITAESLNTSNLLATYALVNKIDAARIDVDQLWAREAFIAHLNTADISSNSTITIIAGKADDAKSAADTANTRAGTALSRATAAQNAVTSVESKVNTAVSAVDVEYYLSESATELIGGEWDSVAPEWVDGMYMWSRTVTALKNGTVSTSDPTCIAGARGPQGTPGVGADGKTSYFHVKYAPVENPTADQMTETPDVYIGTYVDFIAADSDDPSDYTWARLQGEQGIPGVGVDGKTSYLHIKYSDDGGASFTANNGETVGEYIGQYVDYTEADSTDPSAYTWAKIKGEQGADGIGIADITEYYARSTSGTTAPTQWQTTPPTLTSTYRYLWNYEVITYSDLVTTKETAKRVIGVYGNTGAAGNGIADITNYYLATSASSGVTTSTSGWTTAIQATTTTKKYLWNYEVITYTNGGTNTSDPVIIGTHGETGRGIAAVLEQYYLSTSSTTQTGGEWVNAMPEWESGKYIWTRSEIIYTDGAIAYTDPYYDHSLTIADEAQTAASNAGAIAASAVEALGDIPNYVEIKDDGLYLKDENGASTLKLNSASVNIGTVAGTAADGYSQFTANYVQFGNYQLRKSADGGLVFKLKD